MKSDAISFCLVLAATVTAAHRDTSLSQLQISCLFSLFEWATVGKLYVCRVINTHFGNNERFNVTGFDRMLDSPAQTVRGVYISGVSDLGFFPRGLDRVFGDLEALEIEESNLRAVEAADLQPFGRLRFLYLGDNEIALIERGVFAQNTLLEVVWLSGNRIARIEPGSLSSLPRLRRVTVSGNHCRVPLGDVEDSREEAEKLAAAIDDGACLSFREAFAKAVKAARELNETWAGDEREMVECYEAAGSRIRALQGEVERVEGEKSWLLPSLVVAAVVAVAELVAIVWVVLCVKRTDGDGNSFAYRFLKLPG